MAISKSPFVVIWFALKKESNVVVVLFSGEPKRIFGIDRFPHNQAAIITIRMMMMNEYQAPDREQQSVVNATVVGQLLHCRFRFLAFFGCSGSSRSINSSTALRIRSDHVGLGHVYLSLATMTLSLASWSGENDIVLGTSLIPRGLPYVYVRGNTYALELGVRTYGLDLVADIELGQELDLDGEKPKKAQFRRSRLGSSSFF